ncbi:DUF4185 domain-containing protein [Corynebacterium sp. Q4381]|uniref:DUF4185 domain-containing protein n=1 Tax=Corynebacterium sp. Marseille-Q4381 TaxID=3121597 RepID=UPI002FE62EB9
MAAPPVGAQETEKPEVTFDTADPQDEAEAIAEAATEEGAPLSYFDKRTERIAPAMGARAPRNVSRDVSVQVMGDILGRYSQHVGFRSGDLGMMAPINADGEFAMIFGDSFRGDGVGKGEWMSPVGVVAKRDANGYVDIQRPLNRGERVEQTIPYLRDGNLTLIPSDIINIDGTLYLQAMWTRGLHNVQYSQFWKSTDQGKTWQRAGHYYTGMKHKTSRKGLDEMLSWEMGPDGYVYIVTTTFERDHAAPLYLFRAAPENITNRNAWEMVNLNDGTWVASDEPGTSILEKDRSGRPVQIGEMNLRYVDGYWVLVAFNEATLSVEVRISEEIATDWNQIPAVTIAKNGPWGNEQTPNNWSQPYGGYIVPGSSINDMDIVVSQWNTSTNNRYMSTQFSVRGLETAFGLEGFDRVAPRQSFGEKTVRPALPEPAITAPASSAAARTAVIVLGVIATLGTLAAISWPVLRPLLPPQVQHLLPF